MELTTKLAQIRKTYGIQSLFQLEVFLLCASNKGLSITGMAYIFNKSDPDPKVLSGTIRKLMRGNRTRDYDGLELLKHGKAIRRKECEILLTPKGTRLIKLLEK
jgi:hypothetical protein